ncbi:hypothetical protein VNI00_017785 [Paramarasmius palmivorus]|uniref:Peptidase metallopeptidase domain-containing protein n=1 Tax=Paramarasmius palmivorus TaxID=297713 RepID=A0AAW0B2J2_9AGAR
MAANTTVCGPLPELVSLKVSTKIVSGQTTYAVVEESKLWPNNSIIIVAFLDGNPAQHAAVKGAFKQCSLYANINFQFVDDNTRPAHIRVTFALPEAWSAVGNDALGISATPTMSLGFINKDLPSRADRSMLLHQVGHALGLGHEWDGKNIRLTRPGNNKAINQHFERFGGKSVSNFLRIDKDSVMNYSLPPGMANGAIVTTADVIELSDADKAWLTLNYPGRLGVSSGEKWTTLRALDTLGVPLSVGARILSSKREADQRAYYAEHVSSIWQATSELDLTKILSNRVLSVATLSSPASGVSEAQDDDSSPTASAESDAGDDSSSSGDTPETQDDIDETQVLAAIVLHPRFHETITKLVENDLTQSGINLNQYPIQDPSVDVQQGIFAFLLPALLPAITDLAGKAIGGLMSNSIQPNAGAAYYPGQPLPPDVQQGIFDVFTKVIKNPIFTNVIKTIVSEL